MQKPNQSTLPYELLVLAKIIFWEGQRKSRQSVRSDRTIVVSKQEACTLFQAVEYLHIYI